MSWLKQDWTIIQNTIANAIFPRITSRFARSCNSFIKVQCVTTSHYKWSIGVLQRCPGQQIISSTCLLSSSPTKNLSPHLYFFFLFSQKHEMQKLKSSLTHATISAPINNNTCNYLLFFAVSSTLYRLKMYWIGDQRCRQHWQQY